MRRDGRSEFKRGKIMHLCYNKRVNVYEVHLHKDGKRKCSKVHRLVAYAFVENDDPIHKTTINHKDGDRSNNKFDNLEWSTYSDNLEHAYTELHRPKNRAGLLKRRCVSIDLATNTKTVYESIDATSRGTGVSSTQIRRIANKECQNSKWYFVIEGVND